MMILKFVTHSDHYKIFNPKTLPFENLQFQQPITFQCSISTSIHVANLPAVLGVSRPTSPPCAEAHSLPGLMNYFCECCCFCSLRTPTKHLYGKYYQSKALTGRLKKNNMKNPLISKRYTQNPKFTYKLHTCMCLI